MDVYAFLKSHAHLKTNLPPEEYRGFLQSSCLTVWLALDDETRAVCVHTPEYAAQVTAALLEADFPLSVLAGNMREIRSLALAFEDVTMLQWCGMTLNDRVHCVNARVPEAAQAKVVVDVLTRLVTKELTAWKEYAETAVGTCLEPADLEAFPELAAVEPLSFLEWKRLSREEQEDIAGGWVQAMKVRMAVNHIIFDSHFM